MAAARYFLYSNPRLFARLFPPAPALGKETEVYQTIGISQCLGLNCASPNLNQILRNKL